MPSSITHAIAGVALGAWFLPATSPRRLWAVAATCGALPDIDILGWALHVPNNSVVGHRALTHSLIFAIVVGALAAWSAFRGPAWVAERGRLWLAFALAMATHGVLDAMTTYSLGIEFFAPFSDRRYRFPWQPLTDPAVGLSAALRNELLWALLPACCVGLAAFLVRRMPFRSSR